MKKDTRFIDFLKLEYKKHILLYLRFKYEDPNNEFLKNALEINSVLKYMDK
jgi:hypothetical protein